VEHNGGLGVVLVTVDRKIKRDLLHLIVLHNGCAQPVENVEALHSFSSAKQYADGLPQICEQRQVGMTDSLWTTGLREWSTECILFRGESIITRDFARPSGCEVTVS